MNYYIINPQSGKALDVNRGGNANGTNIHLWERNQSGAQKWVIHADGSIINPQSGKALDVNACGKGSGTNIQLWERNGTVAQKWTINADGTIINPHSGKALDVSGSGTANGTNIHLWERNGTGAQKWVLEPVDGVKATPFHATINTNLTYYIINPQSGKALDVNGGGNVNGTNIHLWERNQSGAQKWVIHADGSIINPQSAKALDVNACGKSNGTNIQLWERNGTAAQKWTINADGTIINPHSGKALDVSGSGTANGTNIHLWERNGTGAQKWVLKPVDNMLSLLQGRPVRKGMWFICHRDHVGLFPHEEAVDIYEEFFRRHPNGSEAARGFLAVKLDRAAISKLATEICMSSYRWDGTRPVEDGIAEGVEKYSCPSNYVWFLEHIHREKKLGWVDFVANVGVNCPTEIVVKYMGRLYSKLPTVGFWMKNLDGLAEANTRGWIFQEMSFGPLDDAGVCEFFKLVRSNFMEVKRRRSQHALLELLSVVEYVGTLLTRRGFLCWSEKSEAFARFTWNHYGGPRYRTTVAELLVRQMQMPSTASALLRDEIPVRVSSLAAVACLDIFSCEEAAYAKHEAALRHMLATPPYRIADDAIDFGRIFYPGMAQAYLETMLTWEPDRENAIFSVACAILAEVFEQDVQPKQMLLEAWKRRLAYDVTVVLSASCTWATSVMLVNSKATQERSALGFNMAMKGTKVLNDCEIKVSTPAGTAMKTIQLEADFRKECSYLGHSQYRGAGDGRQAELFACLPSKELQDVCRAHGAGCLFYLLVDCKGSTIIKLMYKVYQLRAFEMLLPAPDKDF